MINKCLCLLIVFSIHCSADTAVKDITVTDFAGREVRLKKPAARLVALAPHIVENIYSAGAGDLIVGAVDFCDYPEAAKKIPRVGSISSYSLEAIVALKPDLVVVWQSGRGGDVLGKLEKLGITTYASDPHTLEDVAKSIVAYGALTGRTEVANAAAKEYESRLKQLKQRYSKQAEVSVLYEIWNDPIQTVNDEHIISDVIRVCGGTNVFGDSHSIAPKISVESVMSLNPDAIVASGMGEERPEWLEMWRHWNNLKAVKNNHLFFIPPDIIQRHTARILDGVSLMCRHLETARGETRKER